MKKLDQKLAKALDGWTPLSAIPNWTPEPSAEKDRSYVFADVVTELAYLYSDPRASIKEDRPSDLVWRAHVLASFVTCVNCDFLATGVIMNRPWLLADAIEATGTLKLVQAGRFLDSVAQVVPPAVLATEEDERDDWLDAHEKELDRLGELEQSDECAAALSEMQLAAVNLVLSNRPTFFA